LCCLGRSELNLESKTEELARKIDDCAIAPVPKERRLADENESRRERTPIRHAQRKPAVTEGFCQ
jgi:hypothetical protein